jgi:hypothetical protein
MSNPINLTSSNPKLMIFNDNNDKNNETTPTPTLPNQQELDSNPFINDRFADQKIENVIKAEEEEQKQTEPTDDDLINLSINDNSKRTSYQPADNSYKSIIDEFDPLASSNNSKDEENIYQNVPLHPTTSTTTATAINESEVTTNNSSKIIQSNISNLGTNQQMNYQFNNMNQQRIGPTMSAYTNYTAPKPFYGYNNASKITQSFHSVPFPYTNQFRPPPIQQHQQNAKTIDLLTDDNNIDNNNILQPFKSQPK